MVSSAVPYKPLTRSHDPREGLSASAEFDIDVVPNQLNDRPLRGFCSESRGELSRPAVNQNASCLLPGFLLQPRHVVPQLLDMVQGRVPLFTFDDHGNIVAIDQDHIEPRQITK